MSKLFITKFRNSLMRSLLAKTLTFAIILGLNTNVCFAAGGDEEAGNSKTSEVTKNSSTKEDSLLNPVGNFFGNIFDNITNIFNRKVDDHLVTPIRNKIKKTAIGVGCGVGALLAYNFLAKPFINKTFGVPGKIFTKSADFGGKWTIIGGLVIGAFFIYSKFFANKILKDELKKTEKKIIEKTEDSVDKAKNEINDNVNKRIDGVQNQLEDMKDTVKKENQKTQDSINNLRIDLGLKKEENKNLINVNDSDNK